MNKGIQQYILKTGGFQEHIDIVLALKEDYIIGASLTLDREWIGNKKSLNPFAKDITKSFLALLFPEALEQEFKIGLVQSIWNVKGSKDRVICLDEAVHNWEDSDPALKEFLDVFRGSLGFVIREYSSFILSLENKKDKASGKKRLHIVLEWK